MKEQQHVQRRPLARLAFLPFVFVTSLVLLLALASRTALAENGRYRVRAVCDIQIVDQKGKVEKSGSGWVESYSDTLPVTINLSKKKESSSEDKMALRAALKKVYADKDWDSSKVEIKEVGDDFDIKAEHMPSNDPATLKSDDSAKTKKYDKNPVYYWLQQQGSGVRIIAKYSVTVQDTSITVQDGQQYTIAVAEAEHGSITLNKTEAAQDEEVEVTAVTPEVGYELDTLTYTPEGGVATDITDNAFTMPAANVTVTATFKLKKCSITFVNDDDSIISGPTEYDYGTEAGDIVKPADPTKQPTAQYTYTFAGWSPEVAGVTEDATYKATYTASENSYTVRFVNYDGTELQLGTLKYGATPSYAGPTPTRPATSAETYAFVGWSPALTDVTANATYTATYSATPIAKKYTLTFDPAGGTYKGSTAKFTKVALAGETITIPKAPTRSGYTFVCWKGSEYQPGDSYTVTGDHTFTAKWQKKATPKTTYTISFAANGGKGSMDDQTVEAGSSVTLASNKFSRSGYAFTGWNTSKDGTGIACKDKATVTPKGNVTLYAQWQAIVTPKPTMSNSKGGGFASRTDEITFTISQKVPDDATSMKIWVDLDPVLYYTITKDDVTVKTTDGDEVSASVTIEGQRLTVTANDASSLRGQTVLVAYKARVRTNAVLSAYLNDSKDTASIPYQAHTTFNGAEERTVVSDKESFKVRVGSTSSNASRTTSGTTYGTASRTTKAATANTGDPTSIVGVAMLSAAGLGVVLAGAKRRICH